MPVDPAVLVDVALGLVAVEVLAVFIWRVFRTPSAAAATLLPTILAGASLLVALRLALSGAAASWVVAALGAALVAHVVDLARRLRPVNGDAEAVE